MCFALIFVCVPDGCVIGEVSGRSENKASRGEGMSGTGAPLHGDEGERES